MVKVISVDVFIKFNGATGLTGAFVSVCVYCIDEH